MELFAVIGWNLDGVHHVSLWSDKEKAEKHVPKAIMHPELAKLDLEWSKVVEVKELDDGRDLTMVVFDD